MPHIMDPNRLADGRAEQEISAPALSGPQRPGVSPLSGIQVLMSSEVAGLNRRTS
jgi:hypothetical protein